MSTAAAIRDPWLIASLRVTWPSRPAEGRGEARAGGGGGGEAEGLDDAGRAEVPHVRHHQRRAGDVEVEESVGESALAWSSPLTVPGLGPRAIEFGRWRRSVRCRSRIRIRPTGHADQRDRTECRRLRDRRGVGDRDRQGDGVAIDVHDLGVHGPRATWSPGRRRRSTESSVDHTSTRSPTRSRRCARAWLTATMRRSPSGPAAAEPVEGPRRDRAADQRLTTDQRPAGASVRRHASSTRPRAGPRAADPCGRSAPRSRSPASSGRVTTSTARVSPHCDRASSAALATWPTARPASVASPAATSHGTTPVGRWRRRRCHGTVARGGRRRVRGRRRRSSVGLAAPGAYRSGEQRTRWGNGARHDLQARDQGGRHRAEAGVDGPAGRRQVTGGP